MSKEDFNVLSVGAILSWANGKNVVGKTKQTRRGGEDEDEAGAGQKGATKQKGGQNGG
jgi:hypothetical protein